MRKSVILAAGSAAALAMAASAAMAGDRAQGYGGYGAPVGYGPGAPTAEDYPANAQPGQCFAKVLVPEVTETYTEQVSVSPEKAVTRVIPGQCGYQDKTVVVREPATELITIPATFRTVTETVVVRPGGTHTETVPPVYRTVTEQVMVRDGYTVWRPGSTVAGYSPNAYGAPPPGAYAGTGAAPNPAYGNLPTRVLPTGEVLCLVQVPPEYKTITKQVLDAPGRTVEVPYPAETTVVSRQVVDVPAHVEKREVPGETRILKVKVCTPDETRTETIPPEFKTVTKVRTVSPSRFEWKTVDCHADVAHAPPPPPAPSYQTPAYQAYDAAPSVPAARYHPRRHVYAPPPAPVAKASAATPHLHHGKVCHSTCDDGPAAAAPMSRSAAPDPQPQAQTPPAPQTQVQAQTQVQTPAQPTAGGDRAVSNLQSALAAKGYYHGPDNGLFTRDTMNAMVKYQHDNHLAEGRYTGETANSLGITR